MSENVKRSEILAWIPAARREGRRLQRQPWWPSAVRYDAGSDGIVISMRAGMSLTVPRGRIPQLSAATRRELERVDLVGEAIRWDDVDVDVSVPGLLSELLGPTLSTHASGRLGGSARSAAKADAARVNGRRGGRPRKKS